MSMLSRIIEQTERRTVSIYGGGASVYDLDDMRLLLADFGLSLSLKYTAILTAFAYLPFPLRLADFHALIPDDFWREHVSFGYTRYLGSWVPIYWEEGEWFYSLGLGPKPSHYGTHHVWFAAAGNLTSHLDKPGGSFDPPLDTSVSRFTLCHPFLRSEMHDATGIYLFRT